MNLKDNNIYFKIVKIIFGSILYAVAINIFISPNKLLSGGIAGISLILQYILDIPSGYWVFIINLPVFIIGYKFLKDKEFIFLSIIGMVSMSVALVITDKLLKGFVVNDLVIATFFGAILSGIGMGIIFRQGASQGGTDIIAIIIRRNRGIKISSLYFALNGIIVALGIFITSIELTLYTIMLMYVKSKVIDKIINAFNQKKILIIVTEKENEVSNAIMDSLGRGTTFFYGEGAYTGVKRKIIYSVVSEKELNNAQKLIESIDKKALVSVSDAMEVQGKGFLKSAI
ncbi:YitT family protein [Clostridium senegalense]|uniref:YitT family protein n=1 Tax=Clostridium senegalense TaxID=1465809 RepID=UPI001C109D37|nr:YitT family protein [Clostridium senegalense]MBU5226740.1 YitT family protein [Clostridium senegalense]